jgi:hypothetical protein
MGSLEIIRLYLDLNNAPEYFYKLLDNIIELEKTVDVSNLLELFYSQLKEYYC